MKIEKVNGIITDTDICNQQTLNNNKLFLVNNCFNEQLSDQNKLLEINKCTLIFKIDIQKILEYTDISYIEVLINQAGKSPTTLRCLDKNKNKLIEKIGVRCNKCGRNFYTQRGHLMRRTHLLCKHCCYSFAQLNGGMENFEKTMMKKYGCKRPIQNKKIKQKTQATMRKKYGANSPLESKIIQDKIINTMMEKYGVTNPWHSKEFQYKCKKKYINHSHKCDLLMERLSKDLPFDLLYGDNEKLFTFKNHWYRVDGYIEERKFAIEFQGDYYHANPAIYSKDYVFNIWGKTFTAQQVWKKDALRKQELEDKYHIKVFYVWQKELDELGYEFILNKLKKELNI